MVTNKPKTITPSQTVGPFYAYCLSPVNYKFRMLASNSLVTKVHLSLQTLFRL